jgi:hypothetical protein
MRLGFAWACAGVEIVLIPVVAAPSPTAAPPAMKLRRLTAVLLKPVAGSQHKQLDRSVLRRVGKVMTFLSPVYLGCPIVFGGLAKVKRRISAQDDSQLPPQSLTAAAAAPQTRSLRPFPNVVDAAWARATLRRRGTRRGHPASAPCEGKPIRCNAESS